MATIYTIGHSTRTAAELRDLLAAQSMELLVDVRQFPGSRRFPHFSSTALADSLAAAGIDYVHEVDLGGRRRPNPASVNLYWQNASFRAYADHMAGNEFAQALARLECEAGHRATAIMCAEAVPWRCHRWLIADALVARGHQVVHLLGPGQQQAHVLNPHARVDAHRTVTYPAPLFADQNP
ncbi:MAG: DUF488 family protein [Pirellulales bacterium]